MANRAVVDREWLFEKYIINGERVSAIKDELGTSHNTVSRMIDRNEINKEDIEEYFSGEEINNIAFLYTYDLGKKLGMSVDVLREELEAKYIKNKESLDSLALNYGVSREQLASVVKLLGVSEVQSETIQKALKKFSIPEQLFGKWIEQMMKREPEGFKRMCKYLGTDDVTLIRIFDEYGIERPSRAVSKVGLGVSLEELEHLHIDRGLTPAKIAKLLGASEGYVRKVLVENNIYVKRDKQGNTPYGYKASKKWLEEQHLVMKRSVAEIAKDLMVSSSVAIDYLKRNDIPVMRY